MSPAQYLAGCTLLVGALGFSAFAVIRTVGPSLSKIADALAGRGGWWLK